MEVGESGEKRPNFSAISSNNGPLIKLPTNSSSKPSDIRKLVIKNFKGNFFQRVREKENESNCSTCFGNIFGFRSNQSQIIQIEHKAESKSIFLCFDTYMIYGVSVYI